VKNNNGPSSTMKVRPSHDSARIADNPRADSVSSSAPNALEHPPGEDPLRPAELIELIALSDPSPSAAWFHYSAFIRRSILGNPHDL
jgi:hypothetical protein